MKSRKALVVGVHHWHSPLRVGTHYIVQYLMNLGFQVAYLSAPVTPLHRCLQQSADLDQRRAINAAGGGYESGGNLWHYVPSALLAPDNRPLLSSSLVLNYWHIVSVPNVIRKVNAAGFAEVDLLFLDSIYQSFWLSAIDYKASAYRMADNTSGFTGYSSAARSVEQRLISQVDTVFTASRGAGTYAEMNAAKSVRFLSNGVDLERFNDSTGQPDVDMPDTKAAVAIYIGAFEYWFDHQTVIQLAQKIPDLTILLVGPMETVPSGYEQLQNVILVGAIPADEIPAYLSLADVGLIPFNVAQYPALLNNVNPIKLYEYMAAGLPVVSNRWEELENLDSPAELVDSREQFVEAVSMVIGRASPGHKERDYANQHDWSNTLEPLGSWIERKLPCA